MLSILSYLPQIRQHQQALDQGTIVHRLEHMSGLSLGISLCHKIGEGVDRAGWAGIRASGGGSL